MMKYYTGNITNTPETIGVLPGPYYWWEAGAMWGAMIDYWHTTKDTSYNDVTYQALVSQVGPLYDYMVPLHQKDEGNDDQAFWGFATMSAAEKGFPEPQAPIPSWLTLTINLWNTQVVRWETATCGGGLKWQIFSFNNGFYYKNSVSNGAFFQLSARLARYTGNATYLEWAKKTWDWSTAVGLIDASYNVFDGTDSLKNCSDINGIRWSYGVGIYMYGAAILYNYTNGSTLWAERTQGLLNATPIFFSPYNNATNVMFESACEGISTCNYDQWSFKAYLSRFMWGTTQMAPFTYPQISKLLHPSSEAAARSCSGGADGTTCGAKWYVGGWDHNPGVGQQMSALEIMQGLLLNQTAPPMTSDGVVIGTPTSGSTPTTTQTALATSSSKAAGGKGRLPTTVTAVLVAAFAAGAHT
jgi:mannan endo-1,6-alpha-mannosidase